MDGSLNDVSSSKTDTYFSQWGKKGLIKEINKNRTE